MLSRAGHLKLGGGVVLGKGPRFLDMSNGNNGEQPRVSLSGPWRLEEEGLHRASSHPVGLFPPHPQLLHLEMGGFPF